MATRVVWVLRHAKAAAHGPDDHARPLTGRGRRQAHEVGRYLLEAAFDDVETPVTVLCSSATRARQTAELAVEGLGGDVELVVEPALYGADADDVVDVLRTVDDGASSVLVVGHNPTLHELAVLLIDDDREDERGSRGASVSHRRAGGAGRARAHLGPPGARHRSVGGAALP